MFSITTWVCRNFAVHAFVAIKGFYRRLSIAELQNAKLHIRHGFLVLCSIEKNNV